MKKRFLMMMVLVLSVSFLGVVSPLRAQQREVIYVGGKVVGQMPDGDTKPLQGALVILERVPRRLVEASGVPSVMDQARKTFVPHLLPIQLGDEVTFHNSDDFSHNVQLTRVHTGEQKARHVKMNRYMGPSEAITTRFRRPGVIKVTCNMHPNMLAYIFVNENPYLHRITDEKGHFAFHLPPDLPRRNYFLRAWSARYGFGPKHTLELPQPGSVAGITLEIPVDTTS